MVFFENIQIGDKVKWFDPAWPRVEEDVVLDHLNAVRTVTDIYKDFAGPNDPDTVIELDNGTQVYAVECVNPRMRFGFNADRQLTVRS